jgi:muramoyltetrapeptide carboxypeptidase
MLIQGPVLQKGDTIALISPAKAIESHFIDFAERFFTQQGFRVLIGQNALQQQGYFAGTDEERAADLQWAIDHPEVKAIICNRGGYGAVRLFDLTNWANLLREPKWLVGFSDITNFHCYGLKLGIESIHATMPLNYQENTVLALETLIDSLTGKSITHPWEPDAANKLGFAEGTVIGGNLSILYAHLGTPFCPNYEQAILFIEDIGEQLYHLDRIFWAFKQKGVFDQLAGLIVGGMTAMKDTEAPTGFSVESLIAEHLKYRNIPIAFHAPVGHIADNRSIVCGRTGKLNVALDRVSLSQ